MLDLVVEFLHILESNIPSTENGDCMRWTLKKNGEFDIRSYYNELWGPFSIVFPWKGIWRVKASRQVSPSCFVWTTAWDNILTVTIWEVGLLLLWTGVSCAIVVGRLDHLVCHCEKAHQLWCFVFRSFGVSWVLPSMVSDILFGWWNWLGKHLLDIWNLVPLCLMWCI